MKRKNWFAVRERLREQAEKALTRLPRLKVSEKVLARNDAALRAVCLGVKKPDTFRHTCELEKLDTQLAKLSKKQMKIVRLRWEEGLTERQIAGRIHKSKTTTHRQIRQILTSLNTRSRR